MDIREVLSVAARIKKKNIMKKMKGRIKMARKRAMKRRATTTKLKGRARRAANKQIKKKFAGGKDLSKLSYGEKARLEKIMKKKKKAVARLSRRLVKDVRRKELSRFSKRHEEFKFSDLMSCVDSQKTLQEISDEHDIPLDIIEDVNEDVKIYLEEAGEITPEAWSNILVDLSLKD